MTMFNEQLLNLFNHVLYSSFITSILLIFILLIKKILGRRISSRWHYYIWLVVILKLILPAGPESELSIYNFINISQELVLKEGGGTDQAYLMNTDSKGGAPSTGTFDNPAGKNLPVNGESGEIKGTGKINAEQISQSGVGTTSGNGWNWVRIAAFLWSTGILLMSITVGIRSIAFHWKLKGAVSFDNPEIQAVLENCRRTLRIRRNVGIRESPNIESPFLYGIIQPQILLPAEKSRSFSTNDLRFIIMHELVHLKRSDILIQGVTAVLQVVHWFNPLIWFSFARMRLDMELACDGQVLSYINEKERKEYGNLIINLVAQSSRDKAYMTSTALLGKNLQIRERIKNIAAFKHKSRLWTAIGIAMTLLLIGVFMTDGRGGALSPNGNNGQIPAGIPQISIGVQSDPAKITGIAIENNLMMKKVDGPEDIAKILNWVQGTKCEQELVIDDFINKEWDGKVFIYEGEEVKDILTLKGNQLRWNSKWYDSNGYLWANLEKWYDGFAYPETKCQPLNDPSFTSGQTMSLRTPEGRYIPNPQMSLPLFDPVPEKKIGQYSQTSDGKQDKIYNIYTIVNVPREKAVLFQDEQGNKFELLEQNLYNKVFNPQKTTLDLSQGTRITIAHNDGQVTLDTRDSRIIETIDQYLREMQPFTNFDKVNNNLDPRNTLTVYDQNGTTTEYVYVENYLYSTGYLVVDGKKVEPAYDFFRYVNSFEAYPGRDTQISAETEEFFRKYQWTVSYKVNTINEKLPKNLLHQAGEFPVKIYWAYNNDLSRDIGLDMTPYLGEDVQVEIYRLNESLPDFMRPRQEARGVLVRQGGKIIGAYIDAGRHSSFACSLNRKSLQEATGKTWNEWISQYVDYNDELEKSLSGLSPEEIIKKYFEALDKGDEKVIYATQARSSLVQYLSSNMAYDQLYFKQYPDTNVKKAKLISVKAFEFDDNQKDSLEYAVEVDYDFKQMITSNDGKQTRFIILTKESEDLGWRITGIGTGS